MGKKTKNGKQKLGVWDKAAVTAAGILLALFLLLAVLFCIDSGMVFDPGFCVMIGVLSLIAMFFYVFVKRRPVQKRFIRLLFAAVLINVLAIAVIFILLMLFLVSYM